VSAPLPPLTAHYAPTDYNLWRWTESDVDAAVAAWVAAYVALPEAERPAARAALTPRQLDMLLVFAQRSAIAAVRAGDRAPVATAFDALSAVDVGRLVDERTAWPVSALVVYAHRRLAGDRSAVEAAAARADAVVAGAIRDMLEREPFDLEFEGGIREARTPAGTVFLMDDGAPYQPVADLVTIAYAVAEVLEADRYFVETIGVGHELAGFWLGHDPEAVAAAAGQTGTVQVDSVQVEFEHYQPVAVLVVELANADDAELVADAADRVDRPQIAVASGRIVAVLYADKVNDNEKWIESRSTLERLRPGLLAAVVGHRPMFPST